MSSLEPCTACGACCAAFRVSFYWAESAERGLDDALVEAVTPVMACMKGTNRSKPHCEALTGVVGQAVTCRVYDARPSPCREVQTGDAQCTKARARYGLPALTPPKP